MTPSDSDHLEVVRQVINVLSDMDCSDRLECIRTTDRVVDRLRDLADEMKADIVAAAEVATAGPLVEPTSHSLAALCIKCGQEVVRQGIFWVLPSEVGAERVTACPGGDDENPGLLHEVEDG